jgi:rhamnose transport system permease protein
LAYVMLAIKARGYPESFTYSGKELPHAHSVCAGALPGAGRGLWAGAVQDRFRSYLYAIGNNQDAVSIRASVPRVKVIIFMVSGLMAALAGFWPRAWQHAPDRHRVERRSSPPWCWAAWTSTAAGTMMARLALLLVGLMRFGMGLLNIQGQVQSIAIGILLILSILLPNLPQIIRTQRTTWNRRTLIWVAAAVVIAIVFGWFFFWSRAAVSSLL